MRLKVLIALLVIGVVAVTGYFLRDYLNQNSTANELSQSIILTNSNGPKTSASTQGLNFEIDKLKADQIGVQNAIALENSDVPARVNSNLIVSRVIETAQFNFLSVIPLNTTDWAKTKVQQGDYWVFRMSISLGGSDRDLVNFVNALQKLFPALIIENLKVSLATPVTPGIPAAPPGTPVPTIATTNPVQAALSIAIYAK